MRGAHPVQYVVKAQRNNIVVHMEHAETHEAAQSIKERIEKIPHTTVEIIEVHDDGDTDLTTLTREMVERIGDAEPTSGA